MHQRKLSRHNSRQSSIGCETASVASIKSFRSDHSNASSSNNVQTLTSKSPKSSKSSLAHQNGLGSRQGSQDSSSYRGNNIGSNPALNGMTNSKTTTSGQTSANILNVAEMLLHGVADNEILDIWLHSIECDQFVSKFIDAGYDMPTLSRITPQDLTAIGVTDPTLRSKILSEIRKLNLQDGIPNFRPASLSHWLNLIKLDKHYHKLLCDQDVDTIDKLCQLTWEDFEDLGITKLGHQKRIQLAIDRMKELKASDANASKTISEPIYDTNPSQILLVSSAENHSMNGPIINKQSSTSELSSTGSGSMHSVYSAASTQYQQNGFTSPQEHQSMNSHSQTPPDLNQVNNSNIYSSHQATSQVPQFPPPPNMIDTQQQQQKQQLQQQQQIHQQMIYSQPMAQAIYQQTSQTALYNTLVPQRQIQQQHNQYLSHYQSVEHSMLNGSRPALHPNVLPQFVSTSSDNNGFVGNFNNNQSQPIQNRQSMSQLTALSAKFANLPKHQQQQLQQSSIYATLTRQPMNRIKRTPPPVPVRTNSLKSNSLTDEIVETSAPQQQANMINQVGFALPKQQPLQNNQLPALHQQKHPNLSQMVFNYEQSESNNFYHSALGRIHDEPMSNGTQASNSNSINNNNQKPMDVNQQPSQCNATMGKDEDFPPPPSPLPCITESYGITT